MHPQQHRGEPVRPHLPAHVGDRRVPAGERVVSDTDPRRRPGLAGLGADVVLGVVVHAEHVERTGDRLEIALLDDRGEPERLQVLDEVRGVLPVQQRVQEDPLLQPVEPPRHVPVGLGRRIGRDDRVHVERDPELLARAADHLAGQPVRQQQVVHRGHGRVGLGAARRVDSRRVAEERGAPRLVQRREPVDAVTERLDDRLGVLGELVGGVPVRPATCVLQLLREVPVVQRRPRLDPVLQQRVHEPAVEVEARLVDRAAVRSHARPRDREPVGLQTQVGHHPHVLLEPAVVVRTRLTGVAAHDLARQAAERVPDRVGAAVYVGRPLHLERSRGGSPQKPVRESDVLHLHPFTAPCMTPATICRPSTRKTIRIGMVARVVPASTSE